jgi:uncharacterized protein YbcV (DUF1398 family)
MFTLDQINDIHERLGKQATLPEYLRALKAIGVDTYDSFITDGHSEYFGKDNQKVVSSPVHKKLTIANTSNQESLLKHLSLHNQGKTDYMEMSQGLADSGTEKWSFDTSKMTITYYDKEGREMLVEAVK